MGVRAKPSVEISIQTPFKGELSRPWLRKVASHALASGLPDTACHLSLVIAGDDTLMQLNKQYRGEEEVTDVLAFSPYHQGHWAGEGTAPAYTEDPLPAVEPPGEPKFIGEVIISYPQAARQAGPGPSGLEKEMALLIVHGVLHLLGYDHMQLDEEMEMQARTRSILDSLSPGRLTAVVETSGAPRTCAP